MYQYQYHRIIPERKQFEILYHCVPHYSGIIVAPRNTIKPNRLFCYFQLFVFHTIVVIVVALIVKSVDGVLFPCCMLVIQPVLILLTNYFRYSFCQ